MKDSSTRRKGFIAVALITGALIFLLLITILSLVSVQSAAIMSKKQGEISCSCMHADGIIWHCWSWLTIFVTAVACPELQHPGNGTVVLAGVRALELGSMASYSCDQDFALIGDTARFCVRAPSGYVTAGRWNGSIPKYQGNWNPIMFVVYIAHNVYSALYNFMQLIGYSSVPRTWKNRWRTDIYHHFYQQPKSVCLLMQLSWLCIGWSQQ